MAEDDFAGYFEGALEEAMMQDRIVLDPSILAGKPVIRGTRLAVEFIIGLMADGWSEADIVENYPGVTPADIAACREVNTKLIGY